MEECMQPFYLVVPNYKTDKRSWTAATKLGQMIRGVYPPSHLYPTKHNYREQKELREREYGYIISIYWLWALTHTSSFHTNEIHSIEFEPLIIYLSTHSNTRATSMHERRANRVTRSVFERVPFVNNNHFPLKKFVRPLPIMAYARSKTFSVSQLGN